MAKKVNKNMVAALTAFGFVLMAVAGVVMILQLRQTDPTRFTELAQSHEQEGTWDEALVYYNKAYLVSNDPAYLVDVGRMFYNQGEDGRARDIWRQALAINPTLEPALTKLCEYYYEGSRRSRLPDWWNLLLETADELLALDDQNAFALSLRGQARLALRRSDGISADEGLADLTRAVEIAPENVDYALALASAQLLESHLEDAEALFERLMEANATPGHDAARIRSAYAEWLSLQAGRARRNRQTDQASRQMARAEELHQAAVELAGDDAEDRSEVRVRLADHLIKTHDLKRALRETEPSPATQEAAKRIEALLVAAIEIEPDGFANCLLLADLYQAQRKFGDVIRVCESRIERGIQRQGLKGAERKRGLYLALLAGAKASIDQASALSMESPEWVDLLTRAQAWVVDAKAEQPRAPEALRTEGRILLAQRKDLEALAAFEKADKAFPRTDAATKGYLAKLYLSQGQIGAARKAMQAAITDSRGTAVTAKGWITYARILLQSNMAQRAVDAAEQALRLAQHDEDDPDDRTARVAQLVLLDAYHKLGRQDLIDLTLAQLDADDPTNRLVQAQALALEDKHAEAVEVLAPLLAAEPGNVTAVRNAVDSYRALEDLAQAKVVIEKGLEVDPSNLTLQRLALMVDPDLTREDRDRRHLEVLKGIEDDYLRATELAKYYVSVAAPDGVDEKTRQEIRQANLVRAQTELDKAQKLLDERATPVALQQIKNRGASAVREIMDRRFVVAYTREDLDQAERIADEARKRNVDGVNGLTYTGRLHLLRKNPELAVESFRQALELSPNSSQTLNLLGGAYLDLGRSEEAREAFRKAVAVNPASGHAHRALAQLAKERNDTPEKNKHLRACARLIPNDDWVVRELALLQEERDPAKGIERRTAALPQILTEDDVGNLIGLARLHAKLQETTPAKEYYAKAQSLFPQNLSLGWEVAEFHRGNGDKDEALRILTDLVDAQEEPTATANAKLFIGRYYQLEGLREQADTAFLAAADTSETPLVCARVGSFFYSTGRFERALSWIEKGLRRADQSTESETLVREIRGARVETLTALKRFDEAIRAHEEYEARYPGSSAGLQLRGEIDAQRGEISAAIHYYNLYLEKNPDEIRALFRRAGLFRGMGQWQRAIDDLERLKATAPEALNLEPRLLLARAYERTGRYDLAASEMEALMERNPNNGGIAWTLVVLYNRHHDYDRAERVVAKMRNRQPEVARWPFLLGDISLRRPDNTRTASEAQVAVENLLAAAKLADFSPQYVARLMEAYIKFDAHDEGIAFFENTLPPDWRHPVVILHYATLLAKADRIDDCVTQYRTAALTMQYSGFAFFQTMVAAIIDTLKPATALERFRQEPDDPALRLANQKILAFVLASVDQPSEAETILREILASSTDGNTQAAAYALLGILAEQEKDYEKSREAYLSAVKADPENWAALNNLAYLLSSKLGEHETALPYARKAALLNTYPPVLDTVGSVLIELGRYAEAISDLDEAVRIDTQFVPAYVHLAEAYRRLGEFDAAETHLRDARKIIDEFGTHAEETENIEALLEKVRNRDRSS